MNEITPGNPAIDAMTEQEMARFFEEHAGDMSLWSKKPRKIRSRKGQGASTVFSLRLAPKELEELFYAANKRGVTLTEFIRSSALAEARQVEA
jgi:hypothetical protein